MKTGIVLFLGFALGVLLLINAWLYVQQPSMIFYPIRNLEASPADWGLTYEEVSLKSSDGITLHGWYLPHPSAERTLLFFHGNGGNISHRGDSLQIFHRLGLNVLIFDYRGYGQSEGRPSEKGLYQDARVAWHYLRTEHGVSNRDLVIFGRSLGGTVAAKLASEVRPSAVIIESSFGSTRDVASELFPLLSHLTYLRYRFDADKAVRQIQSPVLVLHSPDDDVIPYHLGEKLFQVANEPKRFHQLKGNHNTGFLQSQPGYEQAIQEFLLQNPGSNNTD